MTSNASGAYRIVTVERRPTASVRVLTPMNKIPDAERASRAKLAAALPTLEAGAQGKSFTLWRTPVDGVLDMEPGTVVTHSFEAAGDVKPSELPAGRAVHRLLVGPYDGLPGAWGELFAWCAKEQLTLAGVNWQIYDVYSEDTAKIETSLYALLA